MRSPLAGISSFLLLVVGTAANGQQPLTLKGHSSFVYNVAFSPDGKKIASTSAPGTLKLWDAASGKELLAIDYINTPGSVAFSPDGKNIVTAGLGFRGVQVWDSATGKEIVTFKGHTFSVRGAAFSPDGKKIVSVSTDPTLRVWDAATGKEILTLKGQTWGGASVAFSPDGKKIVSAGIQKLTVWDAISGQEIVTTQASGYKLVAFSSNGEKIFASQGWTIDVFDAADGRTIGQTILKADARNVTGMALSADGKKFVTGNRDGTLHLWDSATGQQLLTLKEHTDRITGVAFSPDGKKVVSGSFDRTVKVRDVSGEQGP